MTRQTIADLRARSDARRLARYREFCEVYGVEMFRPSFPPRLSYYDYPERAPSGALVTHCLPLGERNGDFAWINVAEDGTTWTTVAIGHKPDTSNSTPWALRESSFRAAV